jgi:hypothetical protein
MYFLFFIISFISLYFYTKNYNLSLFLSLIFFYIKTVSNYYPITLIIPLIVVVFLIVGNINFIKYTHMEICSFFMLFYIFFSIFELVAHKYIMHCNKDSLFSKIVEKIPFVNSEYIATCDKHMQHHLEVKPDMNLIENKNKSSLFMGWNLFLYLSTAFLICILAARYISGFEISYTNSVILAVVSTFIWEYLWNKVHIKMHNYELDYSLKEGPYDENLFDLYYVKNLLLRNHTYHHLQKGDKKGNYNVILLGADEWFNLNNKTIDNSEYCNLDKNKKQEICAASC